MAATHTLPLASPGMVYICPYGDLQRFGRRIGLRIKTGTEAIRVLATWLPSFCQKLNEGQYQVRAAGCDVGKNELSVRLDEPLVNGAMIHIVSCLAGAKSGGVFQAMLGVTLIAMAWWNPAGWLGATALSDMYATGVDMILSGVAQILAPKAETPRTQAADNGKQNTCSSSPDNMVVQDSVLPALHGEIHMGPWMASQEISTAGGGDDGQVVVTGH